METNGYKVVQGIARGISVILHPFVVFPVVLAILISKVGLAFDDSTIMWMGISIGLVIGPVLVALIIGRVRGRYPDWDVHNKDLRFDLYRIGIVGVTILLVVVHIFNAPPMFQSMTVAGILALLIAWQINRFTKISLHTLMIAAAGTAIILSEISIYANIAAVVAVLLLGTSRVITKSHTVWQVLLGAFIGCLTVGISYTIYV